MINEFIENKCAMTEEIIGVTLSASEKEQMKNDLVKELTLLARECNIKPEVILGNIHLIAELDELLPYNDGMAKEHLLASI